MDLCSLTLATLQSIGLAYKSVHGALALPADSQPCKLKAEKISTCTPHPVNGTTSISAPNHRSAHGHGKPVSRSEAASSAPRLRGSCGFWKVHTHEDLSSDVWNRSFSDHDYLLYFTCGQMPYCTLLTSIDVKQLRFLHRDM